MRFGFADFEMDSDRFELTRRGEVVSIEPKPLKLLLHLLVRHPATVPKEELVQALWPDENVSRDSLPRAVHAARVALGQPASDVIATVRGRGYRIGVPVKRSGDAAAMPSGRSDGFVGREDVLAALRAAFERARAGRGGVALLLGEPGIGKTRTAEELARFCAESGAEVAWGRARRDEGMPALWPWLQLLRSLAERRPADTLVAELGAGAAAVAAVVPAVRERLPRIPAPLTLTPDQERFRFFEAVTRFLERAAAERPLLLVLDDLHQADEASLGLLAFAGETLGAARILLLGTYRDVAPPNPALDASLAALGRTECAPVSLPLGGLDEGEVRRLLGFIAPKHACREKAREIHTRSGGNPFFVRELALLLAGREGEPDRAIPPNVRAAIRERLADLPDAAQQMLAAASVVGREFPLAILADVADRPAQEVMDTLDAAEQGGFVCGTSEAPDGFRFIHPLVQETVYQSLGRLERARLHARAAVSIETRHAARIEPHLASLARHLEEASLEGDGERAVAYAERAAQQDRARYAFGEAAAHYRRALRALDRSAAPELERRCDLLLELGQVLLLDGAGADSVMALDEASALARGVGDTLRLGRAALARSAAVTPMLPDPGALEIVREALALIDGADPGLRVRLLARLATLLRASSEHESGTRREAELRAELDRLTDADAACDALLEHLYVQQQYALPDPAGERLALADRILAQARDAHRLETELTARRIRIAELLRLGEAQELDREIHRFARASDRVELHSQRHYAAAFLAMRALATGRFQEAERWIEAAEKLADPRDPTESRFTPVTQRLLLPPDRPSRRGLEAVIQGLIRDFPMVGPFRVMLARCYQDLEQREPARQIVDEIVAEGLEAHSAPHPGWIVALVSFTTVCAWLGDRLASLAGPLYEQLAPHAGTNVVVGGGIMCDGPVDHALALLAAGRGRVDEAMRHFERALAMEARMGARPGEMQTRRDYARLLLARQDAACQKRAREELGRADQIAREIGWPVGGTVAQHHTPS